MSFGGGREQKDHRGTAEDGDELFHLAIRQMASKALASGKTGGAAREWVTRSLAFADQVVGDFEAKSPPDEEIACRAGCAYCCHYEVVLSPAEALLIGHRAKHSYSEDDVVKLLERIDRLLNLREGRTVAERAQVLHETPCIFLEEGMCSVYEVRPLICRALHSLDSRGCREAVGARHSKVAFVGYSHRYFVFQAVRSAMRQTCVEMGCQTEELTIARALLDYFNHPEPSNAWIQGRKVFGGVEPSVP
jgi:Fe-S-cluster containining protein